MQLYLALAIPIVLTTCWLYTAHIARASFPRLTNERICLLIAHPDDEAMFFAPTILALTDQELGNHVKILCLSSGDAEGIGQVRKQELIHSASVLGLRSSDDVFILEDPSFPDSMTTTWNPNKIADVLRSAFTPVATKSKPKKQARSSIEDGAPAATIDVLITFDRQGISGHPNHTSLYHGALTWLREMMNGKSAWEQPVTLYTLSSINVLRKYVSALDAPLTLLKCVLGGNWAARDYKTEGGTGPRSLMYMSDIRGYRKAQRAMISAHKSQMRWFRWGWIGIGRYMVINDLTKHKIR